MRGIILSSLLVLFVFSCKEMDPKDPVEEQETEEQGIVYEEYTGVEPTKPEETEVYEPVPPVVRPFENNGAPSDAIVIIRWEFF